jgi:PAS domain S-box-containing protein
MTATRILIVEDEILVARDLEQQLIALGYQVAGIAVTGAHALQLVAETQPHLILMDIRLQGVLDGIATVEQIRQRHLLPVIYLTAHADSATVERARVTEPFGYILKPFEERELRTIIKMALYKHEAERKLRASERRFATTLRSIGDAVIATDEQGVITYMNPTAEALTGWLLADAQGQPLVNIFRIINETTRQPAENPVTRVLQEGAVVRLDNHTLLVTRDDQEIPIDDSASPILDDQGNCTGVVLVFRDITERRLAEERVRASEQQVRQVQKMEAIGQLAAGIAHDFNNMLTVINGYSSLLLSSKEPSPNWQKYLERIETAGKRAEALTRQLLTFSRRQMVQPRVLNLNRIVTNMEQMFSRLLGEHIQTITELDPTLAPVHADAGQIEQVLMNLAVNARDAMPNGGAITLQTSNIIVTTEQAMVFPGLSLGLYAVLTVQDTGYGMAEHVKAHLFEPFFTTKERDKGTGLGLATVYGIIQQSNGHITVKSVVDQGTTFTIYLPAVQGQATDVELALSPAELPQGGEAVLLVEDEDTVRNFTSEVLKSCGYAVLQAANGAEALQISAAHVGPLHLLLTDIVMPEMNGWALAEQIARQRPTTKILYMSGYTDSVHLGAQAKGGKIQLLLKPFTPIHWHRRCAPSWMSRQASYT